MNTAPYAWLVVYDHLDHQRDRIHGPRNVDPVLAERLWEAAKAGRKHAADYPDVEWFRLFDDEGELYYTGVRTAIVGPLRHREEWNYPEDGFEPLDDWGTPNAGATEIKYLVPYTAGTGHEVWDTL